MGVADRLEDGFPHGTREGYEQGCRGSHCPAVDEGFLSCAQARTRYQSDYAYKKRVDAGMSLKELAEADERESAEQRARLKAARARRVASAPEPEPVVEAPTESVVDPVEHAAIAHAETTGIPYERHGLTAGYSAGCREKESCPGLIRIGKSCTQAVSEYQRDLKRRKREQRQTIAPSPATRPVSAPEPEAEKDRRVDEATADLREQLAAETARANEAEALVIYWADKFEDRQKRIAVLTDRVAALELELDVAKAKVQTFEPVAEAVSAPLEVASGFDWPGAAATAEAAVERLASTFSLMRVGEGVLVEVDGEQPSQVHFAFGEEGALTGVSVQSGKAS